MGTLVCIRAEATEESLAHAALDSAWESLRAIDLRMHPTRAGSDLAALHTAPVGAGITMHASTVDLLRLAQALHRESAGLFDPCLPGLPGRLEDLELDAAGTVRRHRDLHLDLGGIAKGYAVDQGIAALQRAGCASGLINAGGDLRVFGAQPEPVRLGLCGTRAVMLANAALAVSQASAQAPPEHRGYYSRVDAHARSAAGAAVIAGSAAVADALTKCALFLPAARAAALCAGRGAQLLPEAWL